MQRERYDSRVPGQLAAYEQLDPYPGKYLMHCHSLEHEDMAMMSAFETV